MKRSIVFRSTLIAFVAMLSIGRPIWAAQLPYTTVSDIDPGADTYSPGHHSIATHGQDVLITWVGGGRRICRGCIRS